MNVATTELPGRRLTARLASIPRILLGIPLAWSVGLAVLAPELPRVTATLAIVTFALGLWRPAVSLTLAVALIPAGLVLAPVPASTAELLAWAFLAGWLLSIWRPLSTAALPHALIACVALYAACLIASWLGLVIQEADGIPAAALAGFVARALPVDHLIFSSPEAETWSFLHALTGTGLLAATVVLTREEKRLPTWLALAVVDVMAVLGVLTVIGVLQQWAVSGYASEFLMRYVRGVRFSQHLPDLNAAGSQFVLAGLIAFGCALEERRRRWLWMIAMLAMLPGLWLSGSRTAARGGLVFGLAVLMLSRRPVIQTSLKRMLAAGAVAALVLVASVGWVQRNTTQRGTVGWSLRMRTEFTQTTAGMLASAPLFGVGVGQYYPRSAEFMPEHLRTIYRFENAHNYFAQQFAELGIIGGLIFLLLVVTGLESGWRAMKQRPLNPAVSGLFAGSAGYLLTCATGHPLLVPEAAFPCWVVFGAVASAGVSQLDGSSRLLRLGVPLVAASLVLFLGWRVAHYEQLPATRVERGFHDQQISPDGRRFRWSTRHAVTWAPAETGFLTIPLRAPDFLARDRPFMVQVELNGAVLRSARVSSDGWSTVVVPLREPASPQRVDIRVNQVWTPKRDRGPEFVKDDRPMGVMVGELTVVKP